MCHTGPLPPVTGAQAPPPPAVADRSSLPLPPSSDDFPEKVAIDPLVKRLRAVQAAPPQDRRPARRRRPRERARPPTFHGHHRDPVRRVPPPHARRSRGLPPCRSCHGERRADHGRQARAQGRLPPAVHRLPPADGGSTSRAARTATPPRRYRHERLTTRASSAARSAAPWPPRAADAGSVKHFAGYPGRYGLLHDTTLCVGCRSCEVACKEVNDLPPFEAEAVGDQTVFDTHPADRPTPRSPWSTGTARRRTAAAGLPQAPVHALQRAVLRLGVSGPRLREDARGPGALRPERVHGLPLLRDGLPLLRPRATSTTSPSTPRVMRCTMCYPRIKEGLNPGCAEACPIGRDHLRQSARSCSRWRASGSASTRTATSTTSSASTSSAARAG